MAHDREIPSDDEVCQVLARMERTTARALVEELGNAGHSSRDSQRAVQRCLDRGKIRLGAGLRLELAQDRELVAA